MRENNKIRVLWPLPCYMLAGSWLICLCHSLVYSVPSPWPMLEGRGGELGCCYRSLQATVDVTRSTIDPGAKRQIDQACAIETTSLSGDVPLCGYVSGTGR